ncbi:MAG TPA: CheR family methyltransferase [Candidatus Brocadiaceae bacterium]|nr:CheR family methyltransferase [Candidatus Brocadiaceae bacterium]
MEILQDSAITPDDKLIPSAQCQEAFCRFILARTGIIIQAHQFDNLRSAVSSACKRFGYASAFEYLTKLEQGANPPRELEFLISAITVRESYFFRDQDQIDFIRDIWLPGVMPKKLSGEKRLRIWSAGCSGGEEVYTIAILLMEALPDVQTWDINLLGTDINSVVLSDAASGIYKDWAFRTTPKHIQDKYFVKKDAAFLLHPNVRKMAQFKYLNLNEETFSHNLDTTHPFDMVLCRNVFIYLDHRIVQGILKKFVSLLSSDGVLILGASDLVETNIPDLELHHHQNMFYYQHRQEVFALAKEIRHSVRPPIEDKHPPKRVQEKAPLPKKTASTTPAPKPQEKPTVREEVIAMDRNGLWHEIPVFVDAYTAGHGEDAFLTGMKAKALAGLGNLVAAVDLCNHSIELDKTCKYCYYIKATILIEMGKLEDAQHALRRAIYLDHHFFEAHFHLGQLLVRFHNYKAGLKSLRNALELAEKADPERLLFIEQELTCGQLVEILKSEIGVYEARDGKGS